MKKAVVLALVLTLFSASALYAHDTWVAKDGNVLVVKYGHGDKIEPYKPAYVKEAKAYDASGKEVQVTIKPQDVRAVLAPAQAPALVAIVYDSGAWVKTPEGYKNVSKREAKDVLQSMKGETHSKNIWHWSDRFSKPLGGKMELVPLKNPLSLKVGDTLPFQVIYRGKPLAGATVAAEGVEKDALKTDATGKAQIVIKNSGLNVVKANLKTPTPHDPDADSLSETANITFEVK